jgi:hypothetical protein
MKLRLLRRRKSPRRGHTLVELIIAAPLIALLLAGGAAAIGIANLAQPGTNSASCQSALLALKLDDLASEITWATQITLAGDREVTFVVADRTGDNADDTIAYRWSGVPGEPLTRSVNGSAVEAVVAAVDEFRLTWDAPADGTGTFRVRGIDVLIRPTLPAAGPVVATLRTVNGPQKP